MKAHKRDYIQLDVGFFWEGVGNNKKYHMIKWNALAPPKEFGGLGFVDTRAMNIVLLARWIYKLDKGNESMALNVLRKKYLQGKSFCQSKQKGGSQFWQGLEGIKEWYEKGTRSRVGNGRKVRFWHDVWLDECPLRIRFPRLFRICRKQDCSVTCMREVGT